MKRANTNQTWNNPTRDHVGVSTRSEDIGTTSLHLKWVPEGSPNIHPWSMFYPKARTSLSRSRVSFHEKYSPKISGWWLTYTSEKYEFVSWDDEIPNWMESHSKFHGSKPPTSDIFTNMDPASTSTIYLETVGASVGASVGEASRDPR